MINYLPIAKVIGIMLLILGTLMLTCIAVSLYHGSGDSLPFLYASLITLSTGVIFQLGTFPGSNSIRKREGFLIVALGWVSMVAFGTLPYLMSEVNPGLVNALFETASGVTTTGASIFDDIEQLPKGILFWRSLTQWFGGLGIIVLTVAVFPLLGFGGIELFVAESPGPTSDKLHPRIRETARRLWLLYVGLTLLLFLLLWIEGMGPFDAINHALTTMATGGFSTRNASMKAFDSPLIHYTVILFMLLAGTNFSVLYLGVQGRLRSMWQSEEFRTYVLLIAGLGVALFFPLFLSTDMPAEQAFRDGLFQVVSIVTTTGYVSADYTQWTVGLTMIFFILMFVGGCAGSTSGGIKLVRHLVFYKNSLLEFKRIIHPRAVLPLKLNGQSVAPRIYTHIIIFLLLYLMLFVLGSIILSLMGLDFLTAIGATATSLGNVGPGLGQVGPSDTFAALPDGAKILLSFLMLLGRLEIFTILVLFTPAFWQQN
jgi:trk system potassium uptake protein TrkH